MARTPSARAAAASKRVTSRPAMSATAGSSRLRGTVASPEPASDGSAVEQNEQDGSEGDAYKSESDVESLHSDALDEDEDFAAPSKKRKRGSTNTRSQRRAGGKKNSSPQKKKLKKADDEDEEDGLDLEDGQEVVGEVVQAPKTGQVPPGQISQNTVDFLNQLKKPECNDREWFKLHEPVYRLAEKEWKDFIEVLTDIIVENDPQVPHLPPKDVIHRIYRDVRFSNDKTPYKKGFSASFSRSGRKGIFAGYHLAVIPGGQSLIAAGSWQPGKNELQTIRNNIVRNSSRLRRIISAPKFVELFGEAKRHPQGARQNIFGMEDELKVAPKGVAKTHKDIDLLKCRSFAVIQKFSDREVLDPNFKNVVGRYIKVLRPFVHCLNDLMTIELPDSDDDDEQDAEDGSAEAD